MTIFEMDEALRNLDRRLHAAEQILPTLATREDVVAAKEDLLRGTRNDLAAAKEEILATTRSDLASAKEEILATTGANLREAIADAKRHTDMRVEDIRDDIRKVAEGVAALASEQATYGVTLVKVVKRLDRHEDLLQSRTNRPGKKR